MLGSFGFQSSSHPIPLAIKGNIPQAPYLEFDNYLLANTRNFQRKEMLVDEGEVTARFICVREGWLALSKSLSNGERQIIDFALPGDVFVPCGGDGRRSALRIEALTDGKIATIAAPVCDIDKPAVPLLPDYIQNSVFAGRARQAHRMLRLGKGSATMLLAFELLELCLRLEAGNGSIDRGEYTLPLTQQILADYAGLTPVHVCRTLKRLSSAGVIELNGNMSLRILNMEELVKLADVDLKDLLTEILPA